MTRILSVFLWLLWLTTTPIAAQNNPIFKAIHHNKELLYLPEMPITMPAAFSPTKTEGTMLKTKEKTTKNKHFVFFMPFGFNPLRIVLIGWYLSAFW